VVEGRNGCNKFDTGEHKSVRHRPVQQIGIYRWHQELGHWYCTV